MLKKLIATFLVLLSVASVIDACTVPKTKPDFDVTKYFGVWFHVWGKVDFLTPGSKCIRAEYTDIGDAKIGVKNDGIYSNSTFKELCGYATVPDPNIPGSLLVYFPPTPSNPPGPYYVLDTDYDTFASVFSCVEGGPPNSWILSRDQKISVDLLEKALAAYIDQGIDVSEFYEYPHPDDCIYKPEKPDPSCL